MTCDFRKQADTMLHDLELARKIIALRTAHAEPCSGCGEELRLELEPGGDVVVVHPGQEDAPISAALFYDERGERLDNDLL